MSVPGCTAAFPAPSTAALALVKLSSYLLLLSASEVAPLVPSVPLLRVPGRALIHALMLPLWHPAVKLILWVVRTGAFGTSGVIRLT